MLNCMGSTNLVGFLVKLPHRLNRKSTVELVTQQLAIDVACSMHACCLCLYASITHNTKTLVLHFVKTHASKQTIGSAGSYYSYWFTHRNHDSGVKHTMKLAFFKIIKKLRSFPLSIFLTILKPQKFSWASPL